MGKNIALCIIRRNYGCRSKSTERYQRIQRKSNRWYDFKAVTLSEYRCWSKYRDQSDFHRIAEDPDGNHQLADDPFVDPNRFIWLVQAKWIDLRSVYQTIFQISFFSWHP